MNYIIYDGFLYESTIKINKELMDIANVMTNNANSLFDQIDEEDEEHYEALHGLEITDVLGKKHILNFIVEIDNSIRDNIEGESKLIENEITIRIKIKEKLKNIKNSLNLIRVLNCTNKTTKN